MSANEEFFSFSDDPSDAFTLAPSLSSVDLSSMSSSSSTKSINSPDSNIKDNPLNKRISTSNFELKNLKQIPDFNSLGNRKIDFKKSVENLRKYQIDDSQLDKLKKMNNQMSRQQVFNNLLGPSNNSKINNNNNLSSPNLVYQPQFQSGIYLDNDPSDECKPIASLVKMNPVVMKPPIVKPILPPPIKMEPKVMQKIYSIHLNKSRILEFRRGRPLKTKPSRVKRYDIPKPNLKNATFNGPIQEKSEEEPKLISNINQNESFNLPKNDSNVVLAKNSSTSSKEEKKESNNDIDHKMQNILGLVQAEMDKISNSNFLNTYSFESSFFQKENDNEFSLKEMKSNEDISSISKSPVKLDNLVSEEANIKEDKKNEKEDKNIDDLLFKENTFFKDPRLDFFLQKLDFDDDFLSETEIEIEKNENQLKMSDSEDEKIPEQLISSPIALQLFEKPTNIDSPAAHLNDSVKSILRNLSEIKPQILNKPDDTINQVMKEKKDNLTEKFNKNPEFDVRNLLLVLAQETVKKQSLEIERLRKELQNQSKNEVSKLIDLLGITVNNFKLINDKNSVLGRLKESFLD